MGDGGDPRDPGAELRALRERAYGADADIFDDPAALQRLQELQAQGPVVHAPAEERTHGSADASQAAVAASPMHPSDGRGTASAPSAASAPIAPTAPETVALVSRRRWVPVVWGASVLLGATLGAASVALWGGLGAPGAATPGGGTQVALLSEDAGFTPGLSFADGETHGFTPFEGMTAVSTTYGLAGGGVPCLVVMATEDLHADSNAINGSVYSGCRAEEFPATVQFVISSADPAPLRERFGVGAGIRFVLEDSQVRVFVGE